MTTSTLGLFLAEAGALAIVMLQARRYALQHVPPSFLPQRVRAREVRRAGFCRRATTPAVLVTAVGVLLLVT